MAEIMTASRLSGHAVGADLVAAFGTDQRPLGSVQMAEERPCGHRDSSRERIR